MARFPGFETVRSTRPGTCRRSKGLHAALSLIACLGLAGPPSSAQTCTDSTVPGTLIGFTPLSGDLTRPNSCNLLPCYKPEKTDGPSVEPDPGCDALSGPCPMRAKVALDLPGNSQMPTNTHVRVYWFGQGTPPVDDCLPPPFGTCSPISICGPLGAEILVDKGETWIQRGVSCADVASGAYQQQTFSVGAYACQTPSGECTKRLDVPGIELPPPDDLWDQLECDPPPPPCDSCPCNTGGSGGSGGGPAGGGPPGWGLGGTGPEALLRYKGRGAGHPGHPGSPEWNVTMGRYWSHDYAQRIVLDPEDLSDQHVWLITPGATFVEFEGLAGGVYQGVTPSDDYRRLSRTASGWSLRELDGTIHAFDNAGRWLSTTDRNGNAKTATYSGGVLTNVSFPDGRDEIFAYHGDGKLASITEVGVGAAAQYTWSYTWSGLDLVRIDRPDGRAWAFRYDNPLRPGYLTRVTLIGTDGSERVEGAWDYDFRGNVLRTWHGAETFSGPGAVNAYSFSFDNPYRPAETLVTDPFGKVTTYVLDRDPGGVKTRIRSLSGACGSCGIGPNTELDYDDPRHPLLATRKVDAGGTVTFLAYDAYGKIVSRTEAAGTALERTTTWTYDTEFPDLVRSIERPSSSGTGVRRETWIDDSSGNTTLHTLTGIEGGQPFQDQTATANNGAGQPTSIDRPGFGNADVVIMTYDPARGDLLPESRTEPRIGTTVFGYDPFNREVMITDPNGVATETVFDAFDRRLSLIQKGATASEDLVTTFIYNAFGDLFRMVQPEGNVLEYGYDGAGRRVSIERKPNLSDHGERVAFELDDFGNRVRDSFERWNGSAWEPVSTIDYVYSSGCHRDKMILGDGTVLEWAYDCNGNPEKEWDGDHPSAGQQNPPSKTFHYDALQRVIGVSQPWGGPGGGTSTMSYAYDVQDHLARVVDGTGNVTDYTYSDRDLLTRESSQVAGTVTYAYDRHQLPIVETDGRGVSVTMTYDESDRLLSEDYPGNRLDTTYTHDDPAVPFSKGRLTEIFRDGFAVSYRYDRYGRLTRDGELSYAYDRNGNRLSTTYPGDISAEAGYDFADRMRRLDIRRGDGSLTPVVTGASYHPFGPRAQVTFANGVVEDHRFDTRYLPAAVEVPGKLSWSYTNDANGNVVSIVDDLDATGNRSFSYQAYQDYLLSATGPWGTRTWSYDRIGNRLTASVDGTASQLEYDANAGGNASPRPISSTTGDTVTRFAYDGSGDRTHESRGDRKVRLDWDGGRRLQRIRRDAAGESADRVELAYDGRGFLRRSVRFRDGAATAASETWRSEPTYSSDGVLRAVESRHSRTAAEPREASEILRQRHVFYLGQRPVALLSNVTTERPDGSTEADERLLFLSVDHLGTPVLATEEDGSIAWSGGFGPFGEDFANASAAGNFLRFPGQWSDESFTLPGTELYYNVFRWYDPGRGVYTRPEPFLQLRPRANYLYVFNSPLNLTDPDGMKPRGAEWCGSSATDTKLDKPCSDCDMKKAGKRLGSAGGLRDDKCARRNESGVTPIPGTIQVAGFDSGDNYKTWVAPQGDPCVDHCLCVHETYHVQQIHGMVPITPPATANSLECDAYNQEIGCLAGLMSRTLRRRVPGL